MNQPAVVMSADEQWCDVAIPDMRIPSAANLREHWAVRQRRVREQRQLVKTVLTSSVPRHFVQACGAVTVTLTRMAPRALDSDNLASSLKACRDGVADWLARPEHDRDTASLCWCYRQEKGPAALIVHIDRRGMTG